MKKNRILLPVILTMLFMSLAGCAGTPETPEPHHEEEPEEVAPAPKSDAVMDAVEPDHCLDCHTDKERLIETAKPEEVVVSESEGAG